VSHARGPVKRPELPCEGKGVIASNYAPARCIITSSTLHWANNVESNSVF
jgi:hypothetical protein